MSDYLSKLLADGAARAKRDREAAARLDAASTDAERAAARADAVRTLTDADSDVSSPDYLATKSDVYLAARLQARAEHAGRVATPESDFRVEGGPRGYQAVRRSDGKPITGQYREDVAGRNVDAYGRPIPGAGGAGAAEAEAAYQAGVINLNASRGDDGRVLPEGKSITAAEKAKLAERQGYEDEPTGAPDPSLVRLAEKRQAQAARQALEELTPDLDAAKAEAEAALEAANARLAKSHPSSKEK